MKRQLTVLLALLTALLVVQAPAQAAPPAVGGGSAPPVLSPTPYMGWNTYYALGGDPTDAEIRSIADFLVSSGLRDAGYEYVWIDGNWAAPTPRSGAGDLVPNPDQFPHGLAPLVDYIHSKGLKAGIYTDAGPYIPGKCGLGSGGHYQRDADQFAAWEFDAVKVDYLCGIAADLDPRTVFTEFARALRNNASGRPMIFNLCNPVTSPDWGDYPEEQQSTYSWAYAPGIAQSWRTYTDVGFVGEIKFKDVLRNYDANARHTRLRTTVGIDDAVRNVGPEGGTSTFEVIGDGRVLFDSGVVTRDAVREADVDVTGVRVLDLVVGDGGDGGYNDRADWAGLSVSC
ncbi:NPCBM/NEW2 domain-containing protein [Streptomyces labedae]|uniref:Alpha-galactosidase n=1 Tax=Streptomyces labedae TaxID=285569 RepID=A0ABP6QSG7_9ACTN